MHVEENGDSISKVKEIRKCKVGYGVMNNLVCLEQRVRLREEGRDYSIKYSKKSLDRWELSMMSEVPLRGNQILF